MLSLVPVSLVSTVPPVQSHRGSPTREVCDDRTVVPVALPSASNSLSPTLIGLRGLTPSPGEAAALDPAA